MNETEGILYEIQYKIRNDKDEYVWVLYNKKSRFFFEDEARKRFEEITNIWVHLHGELRLVRCTCQYETLMTREDIKEFTGSIIPSLYLNPKD